MVACFIAIHIKSHHVRLGVIIGVNKALIQKMKPGPGAPLLARCMLAINIIKIHLRISVTTVAGPHEGADITAALLIIKILTVNV